MAKVCCDKQELECNECLNDRDYLIDVLSTLKQITINTSISLIETSNNKLYKKEKEFFDNISKLQKETYELAWNKGWYILEDAPSSKLKETYNTLNEKMKELEDI